MPYCVLPSSCWLLPASKAEVGRAGLLLLNRSTASQTQAKNDHVWYQNGEIRVPAGACQPPSGPMGPQSPFPRIGSPERKSGSRSLSAGRYHFGQFWPENTHPSLVPSKASQRGIQYLKSAKITFYILGLPFLKPPKEGGLSDPLLPVEVRVMLRWAPELLKAYFHVQDLHTALYSACSIVQHWAKRRGEGGDRYF